MSEDAQKRTFAKWVNAQLGREAVVDLFQDLRDGAALLELVDRLAGSPGEGGDVRHRGPERGTLRVHKLSNVSAALVKLEERGVRLVNVNSVDVVDGNVKITLALVWAIILHWQLQEVLGLGRQQRQQQSLERCLLAWCRQSTVEAAPDGVDIVDFSESWRDGKAFCALLHHHKPDFLDWERERDPNRRPMERLEAAFSAMHKHLGLAKLLDPSDVCGARRPDKKSVMTYVMCIFEVLPHDDIDMSTLSDLTLGSDSIGSPFKTPMKYLKNGKTK